MSSFKNMRLLGVGNYCQVYMLHLLNTNVFEKGIALDDGTDSLTAVTRRHAAFSKSMDGTSPSIATQQAPILKGLKHWIDSRFVRMVDNHPEVNIEFFSVYEIDIPERSTFARNDYTELRRTLTLGERSEAIFFLGQPLIEDGYLTEQTFTRLLEAVVSIYNSDNLLYVTHKRESERTHRLVSKIGIELVSFVEPIELVLASGDVCPSTISSFHTSALENCRLIFDGTFSLDAFRIPSDLLLHNQEAVDEIYRYFKSAGINIVPL